MSEVCCLLNEARQKRGYTSSMMMVIMREMGRKTMGGREGNHNLRALCVDVAPVPVVVSVGDMWRCD